MWDQISEHPRYLALQAHWAIITCNCIYTYCIDGYGLLGCSAHLCHKHLVETDPCFNLTYILPSYNRGICMGITVSHIIKYVDNHKHTSSLRTPYGLCNIHNGPLLIRAANNGNRTRNSSSIQTANPHL